MCTQELIWCHCGHGELFPIQTCSRAKLLGFCYTIVHGNHAVVVESDCSYCQAGLNGGRGGLGSARPVGEVARRVEELEDGGELGRLLEQSEGWKEEGEEEEDGRAGGDGGGGRGVGGELEDDVSKTGGYDWEEELGELWRYCENLERDDGSATAMGQSHDGGRSGSMQL
ncbi:Hypothetical predicted protein [Lecanosticta acicola]|uniref:Uncharacterized protein n=1 Tax=Lecanosticta acicola TaxID=111012 RepID=A0AAI8YVV2_9PEZI|nr:Hypothetical predicted protein [Lecanosticta acicola]